MDHKGTALSLEPFTTEPHPGSFCSHFIKLNALTMSSFSHTKCPKAAVRTAPLGSRLPLGGELTAPAQAGPDGRDGTGCVCQPGHPAVQEDTCVRARGSGSAHLHGQHLCPAGPGHATPCPVAHTPPTRTQHRTRGTSRLELLLIFFLMYHNEQETYVMK